MTKYTVHIGQNRGKPRLWIQGRVLADACIHPGDRFDVTMKPGRVHIIVKKDGARKISGKGEVGIIDITGESLREVGPIGTALQITPSCKQLILKAGRV